jgi:hypothetical protein
MVDGADNAMRTDKDITCPLSVRPHASELPVHADKADISDVLAS